MREHGVDETIIEQIRTDDRADFNSNRRFYHWTSDFGEYLEGMADREQNTELKECTQHYIREDALKQLVLKQLQRFLSYLQQFERVFIRRQIDATLAERRYELSAKQKQIEKDEKRIKELDRLFRKIYEDNVNGKLNDERFYKLSDGYEAEQEQLKQETSISLLD